MYVEGVDLHAPMAPPLWELVLTAMIVVSQELMRGIYVKKFIDG